MILSAAGILQRKCQILLKNVDLSNFIITLCDLLSILKIIYEVARLFHV